MGNAKTQFGSTTKHMYIPLIIICLQSIFNSEEISQMLCPPLLYPVHHEKNLIGSTTITVFTLFSSKREPNASIPYLTNVFYLLRRFFSNIIIHQFGSTTITTFTVFSSESESNTSNPDLTNIFYFIQRFFFDTAIHP